MNIEPYDHPLRYLVQSESEDGVTYLVDFSTDPPSCSCADWHSRRRPKLMAGGSIEANNCKHQRAVLEQMKWRMLELLRQQYR